MDFRKAAAKEQDAVVVEATAVPPGWVALTMGADRKVIYEYGDETAAFRRQQLQQDGVADAYKLYVQKVYADRVLRLLGHAPAAEHSESDGDSDGED